MVQLSSRGAFIAEVVACLRQYCNGSPSSPETDRLAALAARIVQQKLYGRLRAAARTEEAEPDHLALSLVGTLFCPQGRCSMLASALEEAPESDDISLFLRFQAVTVRTAAQELFHRWSENDPLSARLWRNLQRLLRHDSRVLAFPVERPEWVTLASQKELRPRLPSLNHAEIVQLLNEAENPGAALTEPVLAVLTYAATRADRRAAVSAEILFTALRETIAQTLGDELAAQSPVRWENPALLLAVEQATERVYHDIAARLGRYQTTGKLSAQITNGFKLALTDLLADCVDGGPAQSYYDYLRAHQPELTKEIYRTEFRAKFEYLAEAVCQGFLEAMREQLAMEKSAPGGKGIY